VETKKNEFNYDFEEKARKRAGRLKAQIDLGRDPNIRVSKDSKSITITVTSSITYPIRLHGRW
jgi:hypothetical protein